MFNTAQSMVELTNLYTNYTPTGLWYQKRKYAKSMIIALTTALKKQRAKDSACNKPPGKTSGKPNSLTKWRFKHTRKDKSDSEGNNFGWCKKHGRREENGVHRGMYMTALHDREEWKERKTAGNTAWKDKQNDRATAKLKANDADPDPK